MSKRVTLIGLFDNKTIETIINMVLSLGAKTCKVPFGFGIEDEARQELDTLPFHLTISAWLKAYKTRALDLLGKIDFKETEVQIDSIRIKHNQNHTYSLCLYVKYNETLTQIHQTAYSALPTRQYSPDHFAFHITLAVEKEYAIIAQMHRVLKANFKPFKATIKKLALYEIYPAELIKEK